MASIIQTALASDGAQMVDEIGNAVTWNGTDYSALVGDPDVSVDLQEGGFMPSGDLQIKILRTAFTGAIPAETQTVIYNEETYVITRARTKMDSAFIILDLDTNA